MAVHGFTLYDMIGRGASLYGDAPAILQGDRAWSFREFHRRVDALAGGLAGLGGGRGDRVCILAQNDVAYRDAQEQYGSEFPWKLQAVPGAPRRMMMNGNQAIAMGALASVSLGGAYVFDGALACLAAGLLAYGWRTQRPRPADAGPSA